MWSIEIKASRLVSTSLVNHNQTDLEHNLTHENWGWDGIPNSNGPAQRVQWGTLVDVFHISWNHWKLWIFQILPDSSRFFQILPDVPKSCPSFASPAPGFTTWLGGGHLQIHRQAVAWHGWGGGTVEATPGGVLSQVSTPKSSDHFDILGVLRIQVYLPFWYIVPSNPFWSWNPWWLGDPPFLESPEWGQCWRTRSPKVLLARGAANLPVWASKLTTPDIPEITSHHVCFSHVDHSSESQCRKAGSWWRGERPFHENQGLSLGMITCDFWDVHLQVGSCPATDTGHSCNSTRPPSKTVKTLSESA